MSFLRLFGFTARSFSEASSLKKRNSIGRLIGKDLLREKNSSVTVSVIPQRQNESLLYPIVAACTAESYDFPKLLPFLQKNYTLSPFICDDVLHVQIPNKSGEVFFFKNGSLVFWSNNSEIDEENLLVELKMNLLPKIKSFEVSPFDEPDFEELNYKITSVQSTGIVDEVIVLNSEKASIKEKLAFSNGLADSVKLGVLERMMDRHIDRVKDIPSALISGGKVGLRRKEMLFLTGELLHFRAQLNLNSDLIDTPEIYWSEPKIEELYIRISRVLETRRRTATLNKKLDYAKEMAQVLSDHLAEKHGLKLEWGIIILIAVEVAFETFHLAEKIFF